MTATLRFASALVLDLAISKCTRPHHNLIFQPGTERPRCSVVKIHDPEPVAREVIEIWDDSEDFDPNLWPYKEPVTPKKQPQVPWIPVMTNYGTRAV